jgi:hypothetical protein
MRPTSGRSRPSGDGVVNDRQHLGLEIDIRPSQTGDLTAPQPRQGELPRVAKSIVVDRSEQRLDLRLGVGVESLVRLGNTVDILGDIPCDETLLVSVGEALIDGRDDLVHGHSGPRPARASLCGASSPVQQVGRPPV